MGVQVGSDSYICTKLQVRGLQECPEGDLSVRDTRPDDRSGLGSLGESDCATTDLSSLSTDPKLKAAVGDEAGWSSSLTRLREYWE